MSRIKHAHRLVLLGTLLIIALTWPAIIQLVGPWGEQSWKNDKIPRGASYQDYFYTIGITGVTGTDNSHFYYPRGVEVNATGHVYVADMENHRVQVFDSAGTYQYTLGVTDVSGTDNAHFRFPLEVAVNSSGHVYVADSGNYRVQVFDHAGVYKYTIGTTGDLGSDNTHFYSPVAVAVNSSGYVYVADPGNFRVQVFNSTGVYLYTIGTTGASGTDNAHFDDPRGIGVNSTGAVYVCDMDNHRIQVFNEAGIYLYTIGETGVPGTDNAHFYYPASVAINATGHVYAMDGANERVQVLDCAGNYLYTIGETGVTGSDNTHFNSAFTVALDATDHLYVADTMNQRVQVFGVPVPTGLYIKINDGATQTGSTNVILTLNATGATEMCFSNNGTTYTDWEAYSTSKSWTLDAVPGFRTVFFKARNGTNEAATPAFDTILYVALPSSLSISINGGAADTSSTSVTLTLGAIGATEMCFSNNGTTYTGWEVYGTSKVWILDTVAGVRTVYFNARNSTYEAGPVSDTITYILAPSGLSISINGGAADTGSTSVTLTLAATGATEMCFSNNGTTYTDWEGFNPLKAWVLDSGPGPKTVYFNARNSTYEAGPVSDTITNIIPPSGLSISIDGGAADTASTSVTLTLSAAGATEMCFSNNGTKYTDWEAYGTSKTWVLDAVAGERMVYFKARNSTIEAAAPVSDTITYVLGPTVLSISIDGGALDTGDTSVTLTLSATGATQMCFSNDGIAYSSWEAYGTSKTWTLEAVAGERTVYFKARNSTYEAGPESDTITYVLAPTGLTISIDSGATETGSTSVTLTISVTGATEMCFSNNGTTYTNWEAYGTSKAWILDAVAGVRTVYFKARNSTIEAAASVTDDILYVAPPSGLSIIIDGGKADTASNSVTLTLSAAGATEMCFSNNGTTYTDWEPYDPSKAWVLDGGPGPKTVYFNARNSTYEAATLATDTISYTLPPTGLAITINGGATETGSTSVTLTISATEATEMCFSNDGITWSNWEPFATTKTWTLVEGIGSKTVYFKARNSTIEAASPATDTVTYVQENGSGDEFIKILVPVILAASGLGTLSIWFWRRSKRVRRV